MEYVFNLRDGSLSAAWLGTWRRRKSLADLQLHIKGAGKKTRDQEQEKLVMVKGNEQAPKVEVLTRAFMHCCFIKLASSGY